MVKFKVKRNMVEHTSPDLVLKAILIALAHEPNIAVKSKDQNDDLYYYKLDDELIVWKSNDANPGWRRTTRCVSDIVTKCDSIIYQIEESYWYTEIPKHGVLCKVQVNEDDDFTKIGLVYTYNHETRRFIGDFCRNYYDAVPLTIEEVSQYIISE